MIIHIARSAKVDVEESLLFTLEFVLFFDRHHENRPAGTGVAANARLSHGCHWAVIGLSLRCLCAALLRLGILINCLIKK